MKIRVVDKEGTLIFSLSDKYANLHYDATIKIFESFVNKECRIVIDER